MSPDIDGEVRAAPSRYITGPRRTTLGTKTTQLGGNRRSWASGERLLSFFTVEQPP
jgi:hypothetical protein